MEIEFEIDELYKIRWSLERKNNSKVFDELLIKINNLINEAEYEDWESKFLEGDINNEK